MVTVEGRFSLLGASAAVTYAGLGTRLHLAAGVIM